MNDAHFHLAVNHLPIIVPGVAAIIMLGSFFFESEHVKRTAYFVFMLGAISTFVAFSSGEGAEEIMEHAGADHNLIHEHEEAAEIFALFSHAIGLISLFGLWASYKHKKFSNLVAIGTLLIAGGLFWYGNITATSGGVISHPEIRSDYKAPENHEDHQE